MPISNKKAEAVLRKILKEDRFKIENAPRSNGQTGVDVKARKERRVFWIEVIGYKLSGPARSKDFFEAFFRAISRLDNGAKHIVIALPSQFKKGWARRVKNYSKAWPRIGKTFPELELWFIDTEEKKWEKMKWCDSI